MTKKISRYLPGISLGETAPASKGIKQPKRNGHAFHPIMNKGGAHEKSKGAQRAAAKRQTNQKVREWLGRPLSLKPITRDRTYPNNILQFLLKNNIAARLIKTPF